MKKNKKIKEKVKNLKTKSYKNRLIKDRFGRYAEKYVMIFLWLKGYTIIKHRFKSYFGEIDIIAFKNKQIIFIEVKARFKKENIESLIKKEQIFRVKKSAEHFISKNKLLQKYPQRYDFIEVNPFFWFILKLKHRINLLS